MPGPGPAKDSFWLQLEVCREFRRARCPRSEAECRFAHPPGQVELEPNGRVVACYDSIKGRCQRDKCKYLHPPAHLRDQLLVNGRNHLAFKQALLLQQRQAPPAGPAHEQRAAPAQVSPHAALIQAALALVQQQQHQQQHHHHHHQQHLQQHHQQQQQQQLAYPTLSHANPTLAAVAALNAAASVGPYGLGPAGHAHAGLASQLAAAAAAAALAASAGSNLHEPDACAPARPTTKDADQYFKRLQAAAGSCCREADLGAAHAPWPPRRPPAACDRRPWCGPTEPDADWAEDEEQPSAARKRLCCRPGPSCDSEPAGPDHPVGGPDPAHRQTVAQGEPDARPLDNQAPAEQLDASEAHGRSETSAASASSGTTTTSPSSGDSPAERQPSHEGSCIQLAPIYNVS